MGKANGTPAFDKWRPTARMIGGVMTAAHHSAKRAWALLGLKADGDAVAFGVVPIVCAVIGALVTGAAMAFVLFLVSGGTAALIARRKGYTAARSAWYAAVAVLALIVWFTLADPLVKSL